MRHSTCLPLWNVFISLFRHCQKEGLMNRLSLALSATLLFAVSAGAPAASSVGDTYVYRVVNNYSHEAVGQLTYRVDSIEADRVTVSVAPDNAALGAPHTETSTMAGNWLRHPLINHDRPVEYEFSPEYPAYVFPLESGKSWSLRVTATNPATGRRNSVRVDGEVLGSEAISTSAGTFDTIKVRRRVYAGDWDGFLRETRIVETDWYAPALGRAVKSESSSSWDDSSRCMRTGCDFLGDWYGFELVSHSRK
jgi:hypothetical protein